MNTRKSRFHLRRLIASLVLLALLGAYASTQWDYGEALYHRAAGADLRSATLGSYYLDFSYKVSPVKLDDNGVILHDYGFGKGLQYVPPAVCMYALGLFELHLRDGGESHLRAFIKQAEWLLQNGTMERGALLWRFEIENPFYGTPPPWRSALAQGLGISVLLRAFQSTGDERYMEAATLALNSFRRAISDGGVVFRDGGLVFFEELAAPPPSHILNGGVMAMLGVYDYYRATGDPGALSLFNEAVSSLAASLHRFDAGFWSKYDMMYGTRYGHVLPFLASPNYQVSHVELMDVLYDVTRIQRFRDYSERWRRQSVSPVCRVLHFACAKLIYRASRIPNYVRRKLKSRNE
ncbi:MAG: D-glucuronyl C5-epimerase family protein [bacterium]